MALGYEAQAIEGFLRNRDYGISLDTSVERTPLGTAGALPHIANRFDRHFAVVNGDTVFDAPLQDLAAMMGAHDNAAAAVALRHVDDTGRYGGVALTGAQVTSFSEKARVGTPGLISGGVYVCTRDAALAMPSPGSLEHDVFPHLADRGRLLGRAYERFFIDIGIPADYARAQEAVPDWWRRPAAFLDRDGVLNVDIGHAYRPEDIEWILGASEAVRWLNEVGYRVIVVTNQAGIAKGLYTEQDLRQLMAWMEEQLAASGPTIDAVFHCPHHPEAVVPQYRVRCDCRKPAAGLLRQALARYPTDLERSLFIGDRDTDLESASRAGIRGVRFYPKTSLLAAVQAAVAVAMS